ncbi:hypothetical protein [Streptosporangium amethystogenes]|uniref:hypothetical protein n=1 Tax=Streptosporangium amethystogenes TaxID=2002 RepID=UPI0012F91933|nr:hypothetical protein [Streptosporangium amethystogenes]
MSMRLNLAKIDVELLESVRANPALIGTILFNGGQAPAGFQRETDMFGDDYRTLGAIAEGRAEAEHETAQWRKCCPWLAAATGEDGENDVEGYEFGYGPAFVLDPGQVTAVAQGLMSEGWGFGAVRRDTANGAYEGFADLGPFYAAAAREGKAVVGGVS